MAYQLSVFAENRPGRLAAVTGILARENINIRATTISTSDTFGVINLIIDQPERAQEVLKNAEIMVRLKPVLAVLIEDQPGGLDRLTNLLAIENINIINAYGFVLEGGKKAVFVVDLDQFAKAEQAVERAGFKTLDTNALSAIEPLIT